MLFVWVCVGGCSSSLLQQLNQESGDEDVRSRQQALSPLNTSPPSKHGIRCEEEWVWWEDG